MTKKIRKIRIEGNIAFVPLTRGYEAVIDAVDVPLVAGMNWSVARGRNTMYATTNLPRSQRPRCMRLHWLFFAERGLLHVDHIDGDGLNNRRNNLRLVTPAENSLNRTAQKNNSHGYKGVVFHGQSGLWRARITTNGKTVSLGLFVSPEEAGLAYQKAAASYHGEFARW